MTVTFNYSCRAYIIPVTHIDSLSYINEKLTINFNKPLKLTGFKRAEKVTLVGAETKQILSKIQNCLKNTKQN